MKSKRRLLILAGLLLVVGVAVLGNPYPRQLVFGPKIQGVPLCVWQEDLRRLGQRANESSFNGTLKRFGFNLPRLDWQRLSDLERETICLSLVDDPNPSVRRAIAWGLALKGPHGPWFQENTKLAPGATSKDAFAALLRLLDDAKEIVRDSAAANINPYGTAATGAVEQIKAFLIKDDPQRRILALEVLAKCPIQKDPLESYIPVLVRMLDDSDPTVRTAAAMHLASPSLRMRRTAKVAIPKLNDRLLDSNLLCRVEAAHALWNLQGKSPEMAGVFREALRSPSKNVKLTAVNYLRSMVDVCPQVFTELSHCATEDEDIAVRTWAVAALGNCGSPAIPVLTGIIAAGEAGLFSALEALGNLGSKHEEAIPFLIDCLQNGAQRLPKRRIVDALGECGPNARQATPLLVKLLAKSEPYEMRETAAFALGKIGRGDPGAIKTLVALLQTDMDLAVSSLYFSGPAARDAVPALVQMLQRSEGSRIVIDVLGNIGPDARAGVPELLRMLQGSDTYEAYHIIPALGQIGHDGAKVVPALLPYLYNQSEPLKYVRGVAAKALARFGPEAKAAIPALTTMLDDDDEELAEAAALALTAIDPVRYPRKEK